MRLKDGYKETVVGVIPEEWAVAPFFDCFSKIIDFRGRTPLKIGMNWGGSIPALSANNVKMGRIDLSFPTYYGNDDLYEKWMGGNEVRNGDVLMTMEAPLGNIAMVEGDEKYILSQRVIALRPLSRYNSMFFKYNLMSAYFQGMINAFSTGTTAKGINQKNLTKLFLPLPPLSEQQKIADILSTVDEHIEETETLIEKTRVLKQGMMQRLLTQGIGHTEFKDTEIGRIPAEWEVKAVGSMGSTYGGLAGKNKNDFGTGYPFITYRSVFDSSIIDLKRVDYVQVSVGEKQNTVAKGDIFFTTSSETAGEVAMCSALLHDVEVMYLNSFCFGYRISNQSTFSPNFARYLFRGEYFRSAATKIGQGSTRYNISKNAVMKIRIPLPPLPEQQQIASILTTIDDQIDTCQTKLDALTRLKSGLMQQLLIGRIRTALADAN